MGHFAVCVQGIQQSLEKLLAEVFDGLGVEDLSVGPQEVNEVAVAALFKASSFKTFNLRFRR